MAFDALNTLANQYGPEALKEAFKLWTLCQELNARTESRAQAESPEAENPELAPVETPRRFILSETAPRFHRKCARHNVERWMLYLSFIPKTRSPINFNQLLEIWKNHESELDANRPDGHHHQHTVPSRHSLDPELNYALIQLIKAGAIEEI